MESWPQASNSCSSASSSSPQRRRTASSIRGNHGRTNTSSSSASYSTVGGRLAASEFLGARLRRARERTGFVAGLLPAVTAAPWNYGDERFWPLYEAAQELDERARLARAEGPDEEERRAAVHARGKLRDDAPLG